MRGGGLGGLGSEKCIIGRGGESGQGMLDMAITESERTDGDVGVRLRAPFERRGVKKSHHPFS